MTTFTEFRKGVHNGHEVRGISELRMELEELNKDNHPMRTTDNDCKDDLMKYIDQQVIEMSK